MYLLHLSGENIWHITATENQNALAHELARVMKLKPATVSENASQLIFTRQNGVSSIMSTVNGKVELIYEDPRLRLRLWWLKDRQDAVCEIPAEITGDGVYNAFRMVVQIIHHKNALLGGLTLHAALAGFKGRGVLLAARGGTGKSSCCRRLPDHWKAWCDDETLVARDSDLGYRAHPFPTWSHYLGSRGSMTWNTETAIPVCAVFFLEQAEGDGIKILTASEASMWLYHSIYPVYHKKFGRQAGGGDKQAFNLRLFDNACSMALSIPAYRLRISLNGPFWEAIEEILGSEKNA
jgi:SynChlorMet cassette protein ScmC